MHLTSIMNESNKKDAQPGEGIRSLATSRIFRAANFELYAKPNKVIMGIGLACMTICIGYITYMRHKYEGMGYYAAVDKEGGEIFVKKSSRWDQ